MNQKNTFKFPVLTPIVHTWMEDLISRKNLINKNLNTYGSPLNIHCLHPFEQNIQFFKKECDTRFVKHKIFFARKANKCLAYAIQSANLGEGVDTASYNELIQCLDNGIHSEQLILTAAIKNKELLRLAVRKNVSIVLDNEDELDLLLDVVSQENKSANYQIRLGGFQVGDRKLYTRFGFDIEEAKSFICRIHKAHSNLNYEGLHFHLNGYSIEERALALEQCIALVDELAKSNITTHSIDIGGGFLMNYLQSKEEWNYFHFRLKEAAMGRSEPLTFQNDLLGMQLIEGTLHGQPLVYPYYNESAGPDFLATLLDFISPRYKVPLYKELNKRNLTLHMEPGRSLLNQCGVTIAKVAFRKRDSENNLLIGLEMNRTQLRSSSADFLVDPLHIPQNEKRPLDDNGVYGYLVGAYCLEQELILKRKIKFENHPQVGDLLVFFNTAGYMMHFYESQAHQFDLAVNMLYNQSNQELTPTN